MTVMRWRAAVTIAALLGLLVGALVFLRSRASSELDQVAHALLDVGEP